MVFRQKKGHAFKLRVSNRDRSNTVTLSTATRDQETASQVEAFAQKLRDRKKWVVLEALVAKRLSLSDAYDADVAGTLDEVVADLTAVDLSPLVKEWESEGANPRYVLHVRSLVKEGIPYPVSRFRRGAIAKHLGGLPFSDSTKNRYRAALSQFARWLIERDVIESNVVRDVRGRTENDPRTMWHTWDDAKLVIDALPEPYRSLEALMAGTGMEWQAIANLKRRDIDLGLLTVRAHGHKNKHRNRLVRITEAWTLPIITKHLKHLTPSAPVFVLNHAKALLVHHSACVAAGVEDSWLHDWRHTYAVNWLQSGGSLEALKKQLGHAKNSTVAQRVYGQWIVDERDYAKRAAK